MNVIIKPGGVVALLVVLLATVGIFFVANQNRMKDDAPPVTVGSGWTASHGGRTLHQSQLGNSHPEYAVPTANAPKLSGGSGKFSVLVREESQGSEKFSKYGIVVYHAGKTGDFTAAGFSAWIDPKTRVLATRGLGHDWENIPLPDGFDSTKDHRLSIEWADEGRKWTASVDDDPKARQTLTAEKPLKADRVALITHDTTATYTLN